MRKLTSLSGQSLEVLTTTSGGLVLSLRGWWGGLTSHWRGRTVPSSSCSSVSLVGDRQPREMNAYGSRLLEEG
jgi:hypothetical protein